MSEAIPSEKSIIVLMAKTGMDKTAFSRALPDIYQDIRLFPYDINEYLDLINNF